MRIGLRRGLDAAFVSEDDQLNAGFVPPYVEVTNPLVDSERFLRSSMAVGLVRAVIYNSERRQGEVRLFEVGSVFRIADDGSTDQGEGLRSATSDRVSAIFAGEGDDAWAAVAAWRTIADALRIADWELGHLSELGENAAMFHPTRSASISSVVAASTDRNGPGPIVFGAVGELDPARVGRLGLLNPDGRPRRVGWLDLDIGLLLDGDRVARRAEEAIPVTRFPSSDIDLAFVVDESVSAGSVERTFRESGGELLDAVSLFDVYRGPTVGEGSRSLAYRLRFSSLDRTLTDEEVGQLRSACIGARLNLSTAPDSAELTSQAWSGPSRELSAATE